MCGGGGKKFCPLLSGEGLGEARKVSDLQFILILADPPLPMINDWSLRNHCTMYYRQSRFPFRRVFSDSFVKPFVFHSLL